MLHHKMVRLQGNAASMPMLRIAGQAPSPHDSRTMSVRESCADRCDSSAPVGFDRPYGWLKANPERSPASAGRSRSPQGGLFTKRE